MYLLLLFSFLICSLVRVRSAILHMFNHDYNGMRPRSGYALNDDDISTAVAAIEAGEDHMLRDDFAAGLVCLLQALCVVPNFTLAMYKAGMCALASGDERMCDVCLFCSANVSAFSRYASNKAASLGRRCDMLEACEPAECHTRVKALYPQVHALEHVIAPLSYNDGSKDILST